MTNRVACWKEKHHLCVCFQLSIDGRNTQGEADGWQQRRKLTSVWGRESFVGRFSCFFQLSFSWLFNQTNTKSLLECNDELDLSRIGLDSDDRHMYVHKC